MKRMLFLAILSCIGAVAFAQKVYFVYIQSETGTPFYVKIGEKVYSSTASGYIILPKLKDSTYSLYLGQPGNQTKELRFSVAIKNSDHGFLLKNFQDGLALFDLQSMAVINPTPSTSGVMYESNTVKSDLFTRLLARAVDDSTLLMEPVLARKDETKQSKKEELKKNDPKETSEPVIVKISEDTLSNPTVPGIALASETNVIKETATKETTISKDTIVSEKITVPQETSIPQQTVASKETSVPKDSTALPETFVSKEIDAPKDTVVQSAPKREIVQVENNTMDQVSFKRSVVKKYAESSNFQGFGLTFIDSWDGGTDTIRLVIPNILDASALVKTEQPNIGVQVSNSNNLDNQAADSVNVANEKDSIKTTKVNVAAPVSNCKEEASNKDFLELRKNMASRDRGEEMLAEARKAFNEKCYTTEQIRKLSVLFYTQEGKFLFFKDAKPFVSDKDRFNTLMFELNENTYQERFKSLLEN